MPRLVFVGGNRSEIKERETLTLELTKKLWLPDIYIYKLKKVKVLSIFDRFGGKKRKRNITYYLIRCPNLQQNGTIYKGTNSAT